MNEIKRSTFDMKKLGFGLMRLPLVDGNDGTSIDIARVSDMADHFMKEGFTYFDTAAPYHGSHSEIAFREAVVKRYPRESYTVTDKFSLWMINEEMTMERFFNEQLERLGVEYMDIYLFHALNANRYADAKKMGVIDFLNQKKAEGKIKQIGFSFHDSADVLEDVLTDWPDVEYVQLQLNYLDWEDENVQSRKCYEVALKHNKQILVMEPIKGGSLAVVSPVVEKMFKDYNPDASVASWAIRYVASLENVVMVLSGMSDEAQMADNLSYMKDFVPMNEEELAIVAKAAEIIRNDIAVPCTACRYCVDDCPMQIPIPDYFRIYNRLKQLQGTQEWDRRNEYKRKAEDHGKASECIECGMCENHCPQKIDIRKALKDVAASLE